MTENYFIEGTIKSIKLEKNNYEIKINPLNSIKFKNKNYILLTNEKNLEDQSQKNSLLLSYDENLYFKFDSEGKQFLYDIYKNALKCRFEITEEKKQIYKIISVEIIANE